MERHKLDAIFAPRRIALLGVTINPNSVGGRVLANLVAGGYRGVVYPVNPDAEAVMGIPCYADLGALPRTPDLGVICSPAEKVPAVVRACGEAGIRGLIIMSAGFRETGAAGAALEDEIREIRRGFEGMRIVGPNCLGVIVPARNLNVSFAGAMPRAGNVAFLSQSGALCTSVLDWALEGKLGFSHFVSIGNTIDVDFGDLIDYFGADETTRSIILYIESIARARRFMTAARAFARSKPIIAFKSGRFPESAQVAASHTGALAAEDAVYDAAFQRAGLARVHDLADIFDVAELVGRNRLPAGPSLGIVTNAGGPGVIAADALIETRGLLARLAPGTIAALDEVLPPSWSRGNPVDVLGDAGPKRLEKAASLVLQDPAVEALLVILTPQAMTNPAGAARAVGRLAQDSPKPVLAAWLGGAAMREGVQLLAEAGVPTYRTPEQAVRAFMTLVDYGRNLRTLYETPKDLPVEFQLDRERLRADFAAKHFGNGAELLPEDASKELLASYGIATARPLRAGDAEAAVRAAATAGYPVVMKILSPDITHKTDVGGVALGLADEPMVRAAHERMLATVRERAPQARLWGVTVQPQVDARDGVEMILGIKRDPTFGTVIMAGLGGIAAELLGDRSLGFPPLNERLARRMLESLRIWPLLQGYRGRPAVALDRLLKALMRLSYLAADYPEIRELDINPLLVTPREVVALDARVVLDAAAGRAAVAGGAAGRALADRPAVVRGAAPAGPQAYTHLALQPYPEKLVSRVLLKDGTPVVLRPIKPEDEPLWLGLLASCSRESLYSRFRYLFHWNSHEVATRFCYIDYDREIAIVAEVGEGAQRQLVGVGRLIADPDHEEVEYAVLIADAWQKKELGSLLTDTCLEIARRWDLKRVVAETTTDNRPMISVFQKRGFRIDFDPDGSAVHVRRDLSPAS